MADTLDEIYCPACGKKMEKIFLKEQGFNVDVCLNGCGGMFFDNREFKKVDQSHENISEILEAIEGKTFEHAPKGGQKTCPVCGHKMIKNYSNDARAIELDECYMCGGIFLDCGELLEIRKEVKPEDDESYEVKKYINEKIKALMNRNRLK